MSQPSKFGKFMKILGVILLGLTAIFHLLGGIGTSCVALFGEYYTKMFEDAPFQWLYLVFVVLTIAIGVYGIRATIRFGRSKDRAYNDAILILVVGLFVSSAHMITSRVLRGASQPNDMRVYLNILTLLVFLLYMIPGLRKAMATDGTAGGSDAGGIGLAGGLIVMGIVTLTVQNWSAATHTFDGINLSDIWHNELAVVGWMFVASGILTLGSALLGRRGFALRKAEQVGETV